MKKGSPIIWIIALLILGILIGRYVLPASTDPAHEAEVDAPEPEESLWTCSMHPSVQQSEPGDCPICGMDLIPLTNDSEAEAGPRSMTMSESAKALAEIQTTEVIRSYPEASVRLVGRLEYDQTLVKSLTARFPARIDQLFVNYIGIPVNKGEHLADVYSPELLAAQREFLSSYQSNPESSITNAAREKLRLWDLLPDQIDEILTRGHPSDHFILKAPIGGVVVDKHVKEGDYVKTGESLFRIVDLSHLWLTMDAYESDLPWLHYGQEVTFTVEAFPGETFTGKIVFIDPEVNRKTRTVPVRVNVTNQNNLLKPGMFAKGTVQVSLAENGKVYVPELSGKWISPMHPEIVKEGPGACDVCGMDLVPAEELGYVNNPTGKKPLVIPSSAVLRTGKRAVVYVEKPNTDQPAYEGREIVLGPKAGQLYLVASGLEEGERVVTHGAFKIDSALQIQAKPSMMNPVEQPPAPKPIEGITELLPQYLDMQKALANDDLANAKTQAKAMMAITGHEGKIPEILHHMLNAETLEAFRKPHFDQLSQSFIATLKQTPADYSLYHMTCPMVYGETGADWLQADEDLRNPYFGASMLNCGETVEILMEPQKAQKTQK